MQVIKKLSDGQVDGFMNYKGNAKTHIICTITLVSFDEILTTLQFASTAKYIKSTPYVNEVSSDKALLKRYKNEIMYLKKELEEVSLETRVQAMEKDQLAQLLEEKDLLQKVQIEKIQNLTQMLVTSSSLKKLINLCSESDIFSNTLDTLTEIEWNPVTKLLSQSEFNSLCANYDNLVLDYEQLRRENEEMELKLKEKNDLDEFETLERKAKKDQENELSSKVELLREKEDQIKMLQEYTDSQKSESMKMDLSYSLETTKDLKQMKQTLIDAKTVALDAKRESAFLRSKNLKLKEKMKELASTCKQMENDMQLYQSQLETKRKCKWQSSKDLLSNMELQRKITYLQKELNKAVEENEALHNEVNLMSELKS
ncbi:hypothetical protein Celaphus_00016616 [Cervus elaphus hippelaphus]|uniref:Kinesin motor domain-containing protein n=1 Tax=Cervus elaphus hippelaphus TaxID=46360 RepID=A0A212C455_CEREH|nr:hypothetical protein Celaphus_00016616 [Cervus elaphus hippelaphus]